VRLRGGGIFIDHRIANLRLNVSVKELKNYENQSIFDKVM